MKKQIFPKQNLVYNHSENQISAIKNDKTETNQGLQNIHNETPRDISQRFSTVP